MKTLIGKDTYTPTFIAALFTTAKTRQQPKCQSIDKWIKKLWSTHTHTVEYYTVIEKNEILSFATSWMDSEIIILSEVRQRKTNII